MYFDAKFGVFRRVHDVAGLTVLDVLRLSCSEQVNKTEKCAISGAKVRHDQSGMERASGQSKKQTATIFRRKLLFHPYQNCGRNYTITKLTFIDF
jgi:hypothetical protein